MSEVTRILQAIESGEQAAGDELLPLVYDELRRLAAQKLRKESPGQTLQPTALVHEAYIRLVGSDLEGRDGGSSDSRRWQGRGHFFAAAAEAMRRLLINRARDKARLKRGGSSRRVKLDAEALTADPPPEDLLALDEALEKLGGKDETSARLVELRFFAGLSIEEAARVLDIPRRTTYRRWAFARAWLYREMTSGGAPDPA